jgi:HIT domain
MRSGSTTRWRAKEKSYSDYRKKHRTNGCVFCRLVQYPTSQVIEKTKHCLIIKNRFGYDLWDGCGVKQHLMVIPRRHVASLGELTDEEKIDYMNQIARFEADDYSIYARSPGNKTKSVVHQHTHLIKIDNKPKRWLIFLKKPHILIGR